MLFTYSNEKNRRINIDYIDFLSTLGEIPIVYAESLSLNTDKTCYQKGENIQISYSGTEKDDWIGIYREDNCTVGDQNPSLIWTYAKDIQQPGEYGK